MGSDHYHVNIQTHMIENITFPQLRHRIVRYAPIINIWHNLFVLAFTVSQYSFAHFNLKYVEVDMEFDLVDLERLI